MVAFSKSLVFFRYNSISIKSTSTSLCGALLLKDGDLIEVKPSDLKGVAIGEAASLTAAILEKAKGKVLFIDEGKI